MDNKLINELLRARIEVRKSANVDVPYTSSYHGHDIRLRLNDFPDEPLFTLFVDGELIIDLEDFPDNWIQLSESN